MQLRQRDREIAPLFSVANSKQDYCALLISMRGVEGEVKSETHAKNVLVFI